jgi:hypothetical protein
VGDPPGLPVRDGPPRGGAQVGRARPGPGRKRRRRPRRCAFWQARSRAASSWPARSGSSGR